MDKTPSRKSKTAILAILYKSYTLNILRKIKKSFSIYHVHARPGIAFNMAEMEHEPETPSKKDRPSYDELLKVISPIAKPLASRKLTKKLYKVVKKGKPFSKARRNGEKFSISLAAKRKTLRRGVKDVTKAIRKGEKGSVVDRTNRTRFTLVLLPVLERRFGESTVRRHSNWR